MEGELMTYQEYDRKHYLLNSVYFLGETEKTHGNLLRTAGVQAEIRN
jgi:hypothetical protein